MVDLNKIPDPRAIIKIIAMGVLGFFSVIALIIMFFILFLAVALSGGTHKEWVKDNICAHGTIKFAGFGVTYFDVTIGNKEMPVGNERVFSIEFKDGQALSSDKINLSSILKLNPRIIDQKEIDGSVTRYYNIDEARFSFSGERLVIFTISRTTINGNTVIKIGDKEMKNFFPLPLTEKQCELLFGKPEKIRITDSL